MKFIPKSLRFATPRVDGLLHKGWAVSVAFENFRGIFQNKRSAWSRSGSRGSELRIGVKRGRCRKSLLAGA